MKLRICDDSIRLRLLRGEVRALREDGRVTRSTRFSGLQKLVYSIECCDLPSVSASFVDGRMRVSVPTNQVAAWACGDEVSIRASQALPGGDSLLILVEKDFACLDRDEEANADAFPNPQMQCR